MSFSLIILILIALLLFSNQQILDGVIKYVLAFVLFMALFLAYGFHISKYVLSKKGIKIVRPFSSKAIPFDQIHDVWIVRYPHLYIKKKIFASGGFWGDFGVYFSDRYGKIHLYTTELSQNILIVTKADKKYLISPDELLEFLNTYYAFKEVNYMSFRFRVDFPPH